MTAFADAAAPFLLAASLLGAIAGMWKVTSSLVHMADELGKIPGQIEVIVHFGQNSEALLEQVRRQSQENGVKMDAMQAQLRQQTQLLQQQLLQQQVDSVKS